MGPLILAEVSTGWAMFLAILAFVVGGALVLLVQMLQAKSIRASAEQQATRTIQESRAKAQDIVRAAEVETKATFLARQEEFEKQAGITRNEIREAEKRLDKREDQLERQMDALGIKERNIEKAEAQVRDKKAEIKHKVT